MTAETGARPAPAPVEAGPGGAADAADRGRTQLSQQAVERLVTAAASEVAEVAGPVTRVLGQKLGSADLDGRPSVDVRLAGDLVTGEVHLSVRWPASLVDVADAVRTRVRERLSDLAGLRVGHLDVLVTALPVDARPRPRVA